MELSTSLQNRRVPAVAGPPTGGAAASFHQIGVIREQQVGNNWCWAAVSVSIRNFLSPGANLRQCQLAMRQLVHTDCCSVPLPEDCDQRSRLEVALANAGVTASNQRGILSFLALRDRLRLGKPVCCAIRWPTSPPSYHFVQVDGFVENGPRGNEVFVNDPLNPGGWMPYDTLVQSYNGTGTWEWTYQVL